MISLDLATFFGRFHPLLVHLPIGFILLALLYDLKWFQKNKQYYNVYSITWFLAFISAAISAFMGWLLTQNGYYIEADLKPHQVSGILLVLFSGLGWFIRLRNFSFPSTIKKINNFIILGLLILVGHLGGSLTHGPYYLYEHVPESLKLKFKSQEIVVDFENVSLDSITVFKDIIEPILTTKCIACHNNDLNSGGLDMTSIEGLTKGGQSGAGIIGANLDKSLIFERITRSQNDTKFMPPSGVPFTYQEIQLMEWWIEEGASYSQTLAEINSKSSIQKLLLSHYGMDIREKPWVEKVSLSPLSETDYETLENANFTWRNLSKDNPLLDLKYDGKKLTKKSLATLVMYAPYITWLNLSSCDFSSKELNVLSEMENLTRLNLQKSNVKTIDLKGLVYLTHLEILNLHSTQVNKEIFQILKEIPSLKRVFLWNTRIPLKAVEENKTTFPFLE